jgi:hypothetical protein
MHVGKSMTDRAQRIGLRDHPRVQSRVRLANRFFGQADPSRRRFRLLATVETTDF